METYIIIITILIMALLGYTIYYSYRNNKSVAGVQKLAKSNYL